MTRKFRRKVASRASALSGRKSIKRTQFSVMQVSMSKGVDVENSIFSTQTASKANLSQRFRRAGFRTGNLSHRKGAKMVESINLTETGQTKRPTSSGKFSRINRFKARRGMHNTVGGDDSARRTGRLTEHRPTNVIQKRTTTQARSVFDSLQVGRRAD